MITIEDVIGMSCLTGEEVAAVAEHEHIPDVAAAALADDLMHQHHGPQAVHLMICEDIRAALRRDDLAHARALFMALRQFLTEHPEAVRGSAG